ncbi:Cof-type HAD-IIB family hydrolase [Tepidibacillus sp. HK-1]|uniref:Cof-type HAD-IIB family hydrolase n=1 Tax=Tepidibacillus sp. HK-1 TaxID=1883407 RepID=UPI0008535069|nr:Cof-type HAD-IIB family hydrolase [Tepidibacillus sp. HK-1]GBF10737.1 putative bifunctional phosphatase/peptidyl-prolyl cis-trans isomerase [Tepidibacillus sp. HK-1]
MEKQLIFFDIDGTLLNHEKQLPISTKKAINRLQELGHDVAIATGRAPFMFQELLKELDIQTYISLNGQYVVYKGKAVYTNPLDKEELHRLTDLSKSVNNPIIYEDHEAMRSNFESHLYIDHGIGSLKIQSEPIFDPEYYKHHDVYQSLLFCTEEDEKAYYQGQFKKLELVRWHEFSVDVMPVGGSKAKGIKELVKFLGLSMDNVYAFGDGLNDIEMLKFVKHSVAMGNAHDDVKKVAKYVTKHVDENGILKGLELVGLLEKGAV